MKTLSITQPWAGLIALGHKRIETRSWSTAYRGPIAIHASKGMPAWAQEFLDELLPHEPRLADPPRGEVVAICELVGCGPTEQFAQVISDKEYRFGDYSAGRYGFLLANVRLITPEPAKGKLGFWEWEPEREENRRLGSHPETHPNYPRAAARVDRSGRHQVAAAASGERPGI